MFCYLGPLQNVKIPAEVLFLAILQGYVYYHLTLHRINLNDCIAKVITESFFILLSDLFSGLFLNFSFKTVGQFYEILKYASDNCYFQSDNVRCPTAISTTAQPSH